MTEKSGFFAAVGTDGMRPVVWGMGATEEEALADARAQDVGPDGEALHEEYDVHPITAEQAALLEEGYVAWPLGVAG